MINIPRRKRIQKQDWLKSIVETGVLPSPPPLKTLLQGSFFYPACGFDGYPIKHLSAYADSFVYADYGTCREDLARDLREHPLRGYRMVLERELPIGDLIDQEWVPDLLHSRDGDLGEFLGMRDRLRREGAFAHWSIWESDSGFQAQDSSEPDSGPRSISLLYLRAECCQTFQGLYLRNKARPAFIGLIQSDAGFAGNWTRLQQHDGFFHRMVQGNPAGRPQFLLFGEYCFIERKPWREYTRQIHRARIRPKKGTFFRNGIEREIVLLGLDEGELHSPGLGPSSERRFGIESEVSGFPCDWPGSD